LSTAEIPAKEPSLLSKKPFAQPKQLPEPNSDFYQFVETLSAEELAVVREDRQIA
jgi:hypothetical protein